ncbi:TonB-dependent receptor [Sphingomonas oligophenolica]|uniref:TonB-dependent receptor n=1 Tax=Sphingomonas oligophenolica TaxID=301154 RepID=A0ABU9YAR4_9SPHN
MNKTLRTLARPVLLASVASIAIASPASAKDGPAYAQPADAAASAPQATATDGSSDIVVTALKSSGQTTVNAPAGISVIPGAKIADLNASSLKDFLAQTPGLAIDAGIAGSQAIGIRGINPSFGSASVGFYVDDLPFSFINVNILPDMNPFDLKSIEVLRGPQSSLYGAGASGGVVRIRTNDPNSTKLGGTVEAYGMATKGGANSYGVSGVINLPLVKDVLAFRGSVSYQDLGGWIDDAYKAPGVDPDFGKDVNDEQKLVVRGKLLLQATSRFSIEALANYSRDDTGMLPLADDAGKFPKTFSTNSTESFTQYGLKLNYDAGAVRITNTTGYIDARRDFTYPDYASFEQISSVKSLSNEFTIGSQGNGRLNWVGGIFFRDIKQRVAIDFTKIGLPFSMPDRARATQLSVYGNVTYQIVPHVLDLAVGGGYAYNLSNLTTSFVLNANGQALVAGGTPASAFLPPASPGKRITSNIFSPKVSLTVHPREGMSLYAVYSEGFRAGFNDNGFSTFFARSAIAAGGGNPALITGAVNPEKVKAYEVGAKANLGSAVYVELALFQNDLRDAQQSSVVVDPVSGVTTNAALNIGTARTRGVEFQLTVKPAPGVNFGVTSSYIDARVTSDTRVGNTLIFRKGDRLNGTPEWTIGANAGFRAPIGSKGLLLTGTTNLLYTSERTTSQLGIAPFAGDAVTRLDARLQLEKGPVTFYVFGQNLLDDDGRISPSVLSSLGYAASAQNRGIPIVGLIGTRLRPRTFGLGARLSF